MVEPITTGLAKLPVASLNSMEKVLPWQMGPRLAYSLGFLFLYLVSLFASGLTIFMVRTGPRRGHARGEGRRPPPVSVGADEQPRSLRPVVPRCRPSRPLVTGDSEASRELLVDGRDEETALAEVMVRRVSTVGPHDDAEILPELFERGEAFGELLIRGPWVTTSART